MKKNRARATAPFNKRENDLRWKFPSDEWFSDVEAAYNLDRLVGWIQNFQVNLKTIGFNTPVTDLPEIKMSALVIDKSMASTKYYAQIESLSKYKGTMIVCDRALYSILPYDVVNQAENIYVCNLDSSPLCMSFFDRPDVKAVMDKITAVFAVTTNPLTIRHWHGKRVFFTPYMGSLGITKGLMLQSQMPYMGTGGQVASFAWLLAYNLGANPIGVFGVTNSYDDMSETEYPDVPHKRKKGPYGTCWQDPVYSFYNRTFLKFIRDGAEQGVTTINTMKAGLLYDDHVKDMSLEDFANAFTNSLNEG